MKKALLILLYVCFIGLSLYVLIVDYIRVGKFQWVDPEAVADQEEIYVNPICVATVSVSSFFLL